MHFPLKGQPVQLLFSSSCFLMLLQTKYAEAIPVRKNAMVHRKSAKSKKQPSLVENE